MVKTLSLCYIAGPLGRLGLAKVGGNNKGKAIMDFEFLMNKNCCANRREGS